jgi:sugar phosphate isomerase/epimerase
MNDLGAPSHLFRGPPAAVADTFRRHGLTCVQLAPGFAGVRFHEPGQVTPERCRLAAAPFHAAGIKVACLTGATHLLDPDLDRRHRGIVRLHALIRHCRAFGADRIVTETGSLSPHSPWAPYPPNRSDGAWSELRLILAEALRLAADHGVTLLLKPETSHVLASVEEAVRLREELDHPCLGFIMDPANFLAECPPGELDVYLERLFAAVGPWAPLVHLKDLRFTAGGTALPRAGRGVLDYGLFARLLRRYQPGAAVILEHLRPDEVAATKAHVERFLKG